MGSYGLRFFRNIGVPRYCRASPQTAGQTPHDTSVLHAKRRVPPVSVDNLDTIWKNPRKTQVSYVFGCSRYIAVVTSQLGNTWKGMGKSCLQTTFWVRNPPMWCGWLRTRYQGCVGFGRGEDHETETQMLPMLKGFGLMNKNQRQHT